MRNIVAFTMAAVLLLSAVSCGKKNDAPAVSVSVETTAEPATTLPVTTEPVETAPVTVWRSPRRLRTR